ncbi:hypothetical protein [Butyrivibrio sp. JL13D10]|uniref:hypothetical protein n=1 Tax=Butyrivibrio sp. JL13D10 TaxID=3236815 RepID=UPI0038B5C1DD
MIMSITVYDFTGIYENESFDFYKKEGSRSLYVDMKDISGTNCICDDYAYEEICKKIVWAKNTLKENESTLKEIENTLKENESALKENESTLKENENTSNENPTQAANNKSDSIKIRFFDNGNYHYMSRILMAGMDNTAKAGFDLVVFDHHPDMKWTSYGDILSCGCWVLKAINDIPGLSNVYIIGADKKLMEEAFQDNPETEGRVFYFENCEAFYKMLNDEGCNKTSSDVYISVDKDVLSGDELHTNWDQGEMRAAELCDCLSAIKKHYKDNIIAVDVCGECTMDDPEAFSPLGFEASNMINRQIISVF